MIKGERNNMGRVEDMGIISQGKKTRDEKNLEEYYKA